MRKLRSRLGVLLSAVAALLATGAAVTTGTAAAVDEVGAYEIINYNSGLCIDIAGNSTSNGAAIHQWGCHHDSNQLWHFKTQYSCFDPGCRFTMIPHNTYTRNPQACMTVPDWSRDAGTDVKLDSCDPPPWAATNQGFSLAIGSSALPTPGAQFRYRLINWNSGMCLEIQDGSESYGAPAQQAPCDGGDRQLWIIVT